jgi:hypothetical protein
VYRLGNSFKALSADSINLRMELLAVQQSLLRIGLAFPNMNILEPSPSTLGSPLRLRSSGFGSGMRAKAPTPTVYEADYNFGLDSTTSSNMCNWPIDRRRRR